MDILTKILEYYPEDGYVIVEGFDDAIIGLTSDGRLAYSINGIIEILMSRNNWKYADAFDYFYYSIEDSYVGDKSPIFINLINF